VVVLEIVIRLVVAAMMLDSAQKLLDGPFKDASPEMRAMIYYPIAAQAVAVCCIPVQKGVCSTEAENTPESG